MNESQNTLESQQHITQQIEDLMVTRDVRGMKHLQKALVPGYYQRAAKTLYDCKGTVLIGTGFPYYRYDYLDQYMEILKEVITKTAGVRRPGSAALDLAHTAAGRFDGFWEFNLQAWDIASGALIVQEAGGIVSDFDNRQGYLESGNIVCGSPRVHEELIGIIQRHTTST